MSQRGNLSPWPPHQHHRPGYYESNYEDTRQFHASKKKLPLIAQTHHPLTTKPGDPEKSQVSQKNHATNPHPQSQPDGGTHLQSAPIGDAGQLCRKFATV